MYAAADPDQRCPLARHFAEQNTPEKIRARGQRLARYKRRRQAAERPFTDMSAFESQFRRTSA